jgi:hypothetical protein
MWDFAVNEECYRYNECGMYAPFKNGEEMHVLTAATSAALRNVDVGTIALSLSY